MAKVAESKLCGALIDRNAAVMPPLDTASMAIEQQAMDLHYPVDPLVIGRL